MTTTYPAVLILGLVATLNACASSPNKQCVGLAAGPRPAAFSKAALPVAQPEVKSVGTAALIGFVSDSETGNGVAHATVFIRRDTISKALAFATADSAGGFFFAGQQAGKYFLEARSLGYPSRRLTIDLRQDAIDTVRLALRFDPHYLSCETVITS
jgi:hypothetical protein